MTKRSKYVLSSLVLSSGFLFFQTFLNEYRFLGIGALSILTLIFFYWSLREGLGLNATLLTLVLPFMYTLAVGLFWFLLPASFWARVPIVLLYAIGLYALFLTLNIFTVTVIKTIALSRAAKGVGFVLTLFIAFLLFDAVLSLKIHVLANVSLVFIISFPLYLQGLWSVKPSEVVGKNILIYSLSFSYINGLITFFTHFWPVSLVVGSLMLTALSYILLGLGQAKVEARLFKKTVREYLSIGVVVFFVAVLVTSWRG